MIYIIGHILRISYSIAQYWWIFSNIIWFALIFLNLDNISKYFAISKNNKRSFSAKNAKNRNCIYQKLKLLFIYSLSRQPLLFFSILFRLEIPKGGYKYWGGTDTEKIIDIIWQQIATLEILQYSIRILKYLGYFIHFSHERVLEELWCQNN